ncbi:MAG: hypothetical protein ACK4MW_05875 [Aquificaceae bacterium]
MEEDRWLQRLKKFEKAFRQLEYAVKLYKERELTDLEKQGISDVKGLRDAFRLAFKYGIIQEEEVWMEIRFWLPIL